MFTYYDRDFFASNDFHREVAPIPNWVWLAAAFCLFWAHTLGLFTSISSVFTYDKWRHNSVHVFRWHWRKASATNGHKRTSRRTFRSRSRQLDDVSHASRDVQHLRSRWQQRGRLPTLLDHVRCHAHFHLLTLGKVQHGRPISSLGLWRQPDGRLTN